jgi:hypothetical protein
MLIERDHFLIWLLKSKTYTILGSPISLFGGLFIYRIQAFTPDVRLPFHIQKPN